MPKPLLAVFALFLVLIGAALGFGIGAGKAQPRWYTGQAGDVDVAAGTATFEADESEFDFTGHVPWYDADGELHEDGSWPECITERTVRVRFMSTTRPVQDLDLRPVLAVDCAG